MPDEHTWTGALTCAQRQKPPRERVTTPPPEALIRSLSASSGKPNSYLSSNFFCAEGLSGLTPITATPFFRKSRRASRTLHDCTVQPGVLAFG
jgi:hypothetical protein